MPVPPVALAASQPERASRSELSVAVCWHAATARLCRLGRERLNHQILQH